MLLVASAIPLAYDLYKAHGLIAPGRAMVGRDFLNCWAGAQLALQGRVGEIYSPDYMRAVGDLVGHRLSGHNFSYPPTLLLFVWPLGFFGYLPALLIWLAATGAAYVIAAKSLLYRHGLPWWTALLVPAVLVNVWAGHHGFVLAALWLAAFAAIDKRPALAGLLIALLTLKPHMGVLIPLVLLVRGEWRAIGVAAAATAALASVSVLMFGWQAWVDYYNWTAHLQAEMLVRERSVFFYFMPTAYVAAWLATKVLSFAVAAQLCAAAAAVVIVVRSARSEMAWPELGLVTATATFLVLPYAFNYDMAVVGLGALVLLLRRRERLHGAGRTVALVALGTPILVMGANYTGVPVQPLFLLAFLFVQARAYTQPKRRPEVTSALA